MKKQRYKQFDPLTIASYETETWPQARHNHNCFELVYISRGSGIHLVNNKKIPYRKGYLFLLGPDDVHTFRMYKKTEFICISFTSLYFGDYSDDRSISDWNKNTDLLLHFIDNRNGNLLTEKKDRYIVGNLIHAAFHANEKKQTLYESLIFQIVSFVLTLIKQQNMPEINSTENDDRSMIDRLILFIEEHIHDPQKLTLVALGRTFNYSPHYIGVFFRDRMGMTLSEYINMHKLRLIERRLKYGHHSVKQVTSDFGFTDESHFNKFFKKHTGMNPTAFKKDAAIS